MVSTVFGMWVIIMREHFSGPEAARVSNEETTDTIITRDAYRRQRVKSALTAHANYQQWLLRTKAQLSDERQ